MARFSKKEVMLGSASVGISSEPMSKLNLLFCVWSPSRLSIISKDDWEFDDWRDDFCVSSWKDSGCDGMLRLVLSSS